ncbi:UNVERIFIED_CONTAM: hypothetical protein K2H54_062408, partial [Gekko kuhli]
VLTKHKEVAVSPLEADRAPTGPREGQPPQEAQPEISEEARLRGYMQVRKREEKTNPMDCLELVEMGGSFQSRTTETISEGGGRAQESPDVQQGTHPRNNLSNSSPGGVNKVLNESLAGPRDETRTVAEGAFREELALPRHEGLPNQDAFAQYGRNVVRVKMEEQDPLRCTFRKKSEKSHIFQAAYVKDFLQRRTEEHIKQEPSEGSLQQWEVQWQEFLSTVDSPRSQWTVPHLPEKPSPWEDAKAFLASFEQVAEACRWPHEEWATRLLPALSGEAQEAFISLGARDRGDYGKVPLEEASVSVSEADRDSSENGQRQFCMETKRGDDANRSLLVIFVIHLQPYTESIQELVKTELAGSNGVMNCYY